MSEILFYVSYLRTLLRLQNCGGDSEQPSRHRGNSYKLFQLVGKHLKSRKPDHYIDGMKSFRPCPVDCSGSGSKNLHFALSARG